MDLKYNDLYKVCSCGNLELIKHFLEHRHLRSDIKEMCFDKICVSGSMECIKWFLGEYDHEDINFHLALDGCCQSGSIECVNFIIKEASKVFLEDEDENTFFEWDLIMMSACASDNVEMIKFIRQKGASFHEIETLNITDKPNTIRYLIEEGFPLNHFLEYGCLDDIFENNKNPIHIHFLVKLLGANYFVHKENNDYYSFLFERVRRKPDYPTHQGLKWLIQEY